MKNPRTLMVAGALPGALSLSSFTAYAQDEAALAKELQNPVANWTVQQLLKLGPQPVAFQLGARYYAEKPTAGPDWGLRFAVTFLFPK